MIASRFPASRPAAWFARVGAVLLLALAIAAPATAQTTPTLPVQVQVQGEQAVARIGGASAPLAELILDFEDATQLSAASLGISARLVDPLDPTLLARLEPGALTMLADGLPLLVTVEPPAAGGLRFDRTVRVEVHTHALPYTVGSSLRLFKAPLGGAFRDITREIAHGSVRARGTTGGFSQFLVVVDLRDTATVIAAKTARLHALLDTLPAGEAAPLRVLANEATADQQAGDVAAAFDALDRFDARVRQRAGAHIPQQWRATRDVANTAGELLAETATLRFSYGYLRDFGR